MMDDYSVAYRNSRGESRMIDLPSYSTLDRAVLDASNLAKGHCPVGEICDWFVYLTYNGQIVKSGRVGNGGNGVHDRDDKPVLPTPTTTCFPNIKEVLK